jgi:hypothetical protein
MEEGARKLLMMVLSLLVGASIVYIALSGLRLPPGYTLRDGLGPFVPVTRDEGFETLFFDEYVRLIEECYSIPINPPCKCAELNGQGLFSRSILLEQTAQGTRAHLFEQDVELADIDEADIKASSPLKQADLTAKINGLAAYDDGKNKRHWKPEQSKFVFLKGSLKGPMQYSYGPSLSQMTTTELPSFWLIRAPARDSSFEFSVAHLDPASPNAKLDRLFSCSEAKLGIDFFEGVVAAFKKSSQDNSYSAVPFSKLPENMYGGSELGTLFSYEPSLHIESVPGDGIYIRAVAFPEQNWAGAYDMNSPNYNPSPYTADYTEHIPGVQLKVVAHQDEPPIAGSPCNIQPDWGARTGLWTQNFEWSDPAQTHCVYTLQETGKTNPEHIGDDIGHYSRNIAVIQYAFDRFHLAFRQDGFTPIGDDHAGLEQGAFGGRIEIGTHLRLLDDSAYDPTNSFVVLELY